MRQFNLRLVIVTLALFVPLVVQANDTQVASGIRSELKVQQEQGNLCGFNINITVENGRVWLNGQVNDAKQQLLVEQLAQRQNGVVGVMNQLKIIPVTVSPQQVQSEVNKNRPSSAADIPVQTPPFASPQPQSSGRGLLGAAFERLQKGLLFEPKDEPSESQGEVVLTEFVSPFSESEQPSHGSKVAQGAQWSFNNKSTDLGFVETEGEGVFKETSVAKEESEIAATSESTPQSPVPTDLDLPQPIDKPAQVQQPPSVAQRPAEPLTETALYNDIHQNDLSQDPAVISDKLTVGNSPIVENSTIVQNSTVHPAKPQPTRSGTLQRAAVSQGHVNEIASDGTGYPQLPMAPRQIARRQPVPYAAATTLNQFGHHRRPIAPVANYHPAPNSPAPAHAPGAIAGGGIPRARYDHPNLPGYAWPSYAASPNYAAVTYPRQHSAAAWPYIGPFYPYPQVPLGWRKVSLEWDDGWWMLDFTQK